MKKLNILLLSILLLLPVSASAQFLDAIRGHIQDLKARSSDHQKIEGVIIKRGQIDTNAKGQDLLHNSSGEWYVVKVGNQLFLQSNEDFRSSPGPDYHVYISSKAAIKDNDEFFEELSYSDPRIGSYDVLLSSQRLVSHPSYHHL